MARVNPAASKDAGQCPLRHSACPSPQKEHAVIGDKQMQDTSNFPIGGSLLVGLLAYGFISMFWTGPLVAERVMELQIDWPNACRQSLKRKIIEKHEEENQPVFQPRLSCDMIGSLNPRWQAFCDYYLRGPLGKYDSMLGNISRKKREYQQKRLAEAISKTGSRCSCAIAATLEKRRTSFALYAGSLRLIEPAAIRNLTSELESALHSPACAMKGE
jgi:hypothetical protein